jgi:hypothetical protein
LDPVRVRSEDHVGAGVDHPMGLVNLVSPRLCVELNTPMDRDDDEVRDRRRVPNGMQRKREVVAGGRSRVVRTRDFVHRIEHLVDPEDRDGPAVDLHADRSQRLRLVAPGADRGKAGGPDVAQRIQEPGRSIVIGMVVRLARDVDAGAAGRREGSGVAPERERLGLGIHHIGRRTFQVHDGEVVVAEQAAEAAPRPAISVRAERRDL